MKIKILFTTLLIILNLAGTALAQSNTKDEGVIINGVKWATRNVDEPGTFAPTPESTGKFYQWNRKKAWNTTDQKVTDWDNSIPDGIEWEKVNDPSPEGWRVPTLNEIKFLFDTTQVSSEWTIQSGVNGRKFTDKENGNSLFLPAVGYRNGSGGTLYHAGVDGCYWSSTQYESNASNAYLLGFYEGNAYWYYHFRHYGLSVRPVAE
jgi:uncharacterized protein (TIGR02145 family)